MSKLVPTDAAILHQIGRVRTCEATYAEGVAAQTEFLRRLNAARDQLERERAVLARMLNLPID